MSLSPNRARRREGQIPDGKTPGLRPLPVAGLPPSIFAALAGHIEQPLAKQFVHELGNAGGDF